MNAPEDDQTAGGAGATGSPAEQPAQDGAQAAPPAPPMPPEAAPPAYGSPAPAYGSPAPAPAYGSPAPQYGASPAPAYGSAPSPAYGAVPPSAASGAVPPQPPTAGSPAQQWQAAPQGAAPVGSSITPEQVKAKLTALGLVNPLPSLAVGGAAYVAGIVISVIGVILSAILVAILGTGNPLEYGLDEVDISAETGLSGFATALRTPFQLVAMALLGSLGLKASFFGETVSMSVRFLPAIITIVILGIAFFGGRFVQKRQRAGILGIWVNALLTALGVAIVTVLAALIFAQPVPVDDGITLRIHAAGPDAFFGALLLITLAIGLGRMSVGARPAWWPLVSDLFAGAKLAVVHALLLTVLGFIVVTIVTTIQALIDGDTPPMLSVAMLFPLLGGHVIAYFTGLPLLSSATMRASGPDSLGLFFGSGIERASIFSMPWYVWLGGLVLGLVVLVAVSLLWSSGRRAVPNNIIATAVGWAALPLTYFGGGIVLLILAEASFRFRYSGGFTGDAGSFTASVGLAGWTPLLALLVGIVVELLSRFAAPFVLPFLPAALLTWFRRPLAAGEGEVAAQAAAAPAAAAPATVAPTAVDPGAVGSVAPATAPTEALPPTPGVAQTPGGASAGTAPYATALVGGAPYATAPVGAEATAEARSLSPRAKRIAIGVAIGVGALFVLIVGLIIAFTVISKTMFSAEKSVESYLQALQDGDAATVLELAPPNVPTAEQALLTNEITGAAENRISSWSITDTTERGDDVEVTAKITQDGVTTTRTFLVERAGRTAVVFPKWELDEVTYASFYLVIPDSATTLLVNGQEVAVADLGLESDFGQLYGYFTVLPGDYEVTLPALSDQITVQGGVVSVPVDPMDAYDLGVAPYYELSATGLEAVQTQVNDAIDVCAESTEADPEGCPLDAWVWYDVVEGSGSWEITAYPTVEVSGDGTSFTYTTYYEGYGSAVYSYQEKGWNDEITDETADSTLSVYGDVIVDENGEVQIDTSEW
ncbi:hypothetical protein ACXET9_11005 [Brachybacterium sp. DNPG3]